MNLCISCQKYLMSYHKNLYERIILHRKHLSLITAYRLVQIYKQFCRNLLLYNENYNLK